MKKNRVNYRTLIVTFAEPIRILDNYFDDVEAWGVASLKEWIDSYESTRFTQRTTARRSLPRNTTQSMCRSGCNAIPPSPTSFRHKFNPPK